MASNKACSRGLRTLRTGLRGLRDPHAGLVLGHHPDEHQVKAAIAAIAEDAWTPTSYLHAIVEQVIAALKDGPIAHLPSGSNTANAAWLAHAVIAFSRARTAGVLASSRYTRPRWATLRAHLLNVPGRVASSARRLTLHLPNRLALGRCLAGTVRSSHRDTLQPPG